MPTETNLNLVLYWTMDCPAQRLWIQIAPDLTYDAHRGGKDGYTKTFKGELTHISALEWEQTEKQWISDNYGEIWGYYDQRDRNLKTIHPEGGWEQACPNGVGFDGEYLDHMQRSQFVLESHDVATIYMSSNGKLYQTPDNGKTIFVRNKAHGVMYDEALTTPDSVWVDHPQACMQQPNSKSYQLSSIIELTRDGCPGSIIQQCIAGTFASPRRPELQKYYVYPTE